MGRLYPEVFPNFLSGDYEDFVKSARVRKIEFRLTKPEFAEITKHDCYLCGKSNRFNHRNGIDRFDNNLGYTIENARPCCNTCNMIKNEYLYSDVTDKFERIYEYRIREKEDVNAGDGI